MSDTIQIKIDAELEDLVPVFLSNLKKNIILIQNAMQAKDIETIRKLGHNMKGSGGGYGFDYISQIGQEIEESAKSSDLDKITISLNSLENYLSQIQIEYVAI